MIATAAVLTAETIEAFRVGPWSRTTSLGFDVVVRIADGRLFRKREPTRHCAEILRTMYVLPAGKIAVDRWILVPQCDGIEFDCATAAHNPARCDDGRPGIPMGPYGDGTFVGDY